MASGRTRPGRVSALPTSKRSPPLCHSKPSAIWLRAESLQQYLGHRNIQHTVRYTELIPQRFQDFWEQGLRSLPEQLQSWQYNRTALATEVALEFVNAQPSRLAFPLQHAKGH